MPRPAARELDAAESGRESSAKRIDLVRPRPRARARVRVRGEGEGEGTLVVVALGRV